MFSRFFIDRPIFASVLSIAITLAGGLAVLNLPLAQYPLVSPPTVIVACNYPGADAQTVAKTVAAPIEQEVNGVENMLYMSSQCANDGSYSLTVTFQQGMNLNLAQVLVQNRVNLALPKLPDVLKRTGLTTRKISPDMVMSVNINSPKGRYDQLYLSNYALTHLYDELLRVEGVSDIFIAGRRDYSMRIWVDPEQLEARNLTAMDVVGAIREQNNQIAAGQIGQEPVGRGQVTQITLSTLGRLSTPEQFADIIVRTTRDGRIVRLRDVGRVELGAKSRDVTCKLDGKPSAGIMISQLPDANALDVADRVRAKMDMLAKDFPDDLIYEIQYDTTPYTRQCIEEVVKSLRDATILVALVVLLFLQNWRSAIIPLVAVPVAIIGTFAVLALFGFSLNNLTLFGLVLAIGIVVDDAIVVVESVEHHIETGLAPRDATIKAMSQVSGPVMAVGLVLSAVFVPCAFIGGITGQFFRQFALTIAASTIISTFNSLTLSPALSAVLLKSRDKETHEPLPRLAFPLLGGWLGYLWLTPWLAPHVERLCGGVPEGLAAQLLPVSWWIAAAVAVGAAALVGRLLAAPANRLLRVFFGGFNAVFQGTLKGYTFAVGGLLRISLLVLVVYAGLLGLTYVNFQMTPKGFIPNQDMGILMIGVQLPDAASDERTRAVTNRVQRICETTPGVKHTMSIAGMSFVAATNASNFGSMFVILDDFEDRREPGLSADDILKTLNARFAKEMPDAMVSVFQPPPVRGIGRTGGFKFMVEDRGDLGPTVLQQQADNLANEARRLQRWPAKAPHSPLPVKPAGTASSGRSAPPQTAMSKSPPADPPAGAKQGPPPGGPPLLVVLPNVFRANSPQLYVDLNRAQCMTMGVPLADAFNTLQIYLGSLYVNDFNLLGRTWQVVAQADARFRNRIDAARQLKVRNGAGAMVPIGTLANVREIGGPLVLTRFNMFPAAAVQGFGTSGVSSRQAIDGVQKLADEVLPKHTMRGEWTEMAYMELQAGNTAMGIFALAVVAVFLVLAAQYESWSLPLAVILVVPMCLLSAIIGVWAVPMGLQWAAAQVKTVSAALAHTLVGTNVPMDINIFTQIGFVVLVGLASKNAILIVEFAKRQREAGVPRREAALEACHLRLRPIVMTSFAFILGVFPLLIARGAGAEMRRTLGTAVFSGMLGVTIFGIFLTPVFFTVIDRLGSTSFFAALAMRPMLSSIGRIVRLVSVRVPAASLKLSQLVRPRTRRKR